MSQPSRYIQAILTGLYGFAWRVAPIGQLSKPDLVERHLALLPPGGPALAVVYREDIQNAGICIRSTEQALAYCRFVHEPLITNFSFTNNERFIELGHKFEYQLANFELEADQFEIDFEPVCKLVTTDEGLSFFSVQRFVLPHTFSPIATPKQGQRELLSEVVQLDEKLTISGQYFYQVQSVALTTPITLYTSSIMLLLGRPLLVNGQPRVAALTTDCSWE